MCTSIIYLLSKNSNAKLIQLDLELVNSVTTNIAEPSGLAINSSEDILYIVRDS